MRSIALVARRDLVYQGVSRATGEIFELPILGAVAALVACGHGLTFAKQQPTAHSPKPKAIRRRLVAPPVPVEE